MKHLTRRLFFGTAAGAGVALRAEGLNADLTQRQRDAYPIRVDAAVLEKLTYGESFNGYTFTRFDGQTITV